MPDYIDNLVKHLEDNEGVYDYAEIGIEIGEDGLEFFVMIYPEGDCSYVPNGHSYGDLESAVNQALERSADYLSDKDF